MTVTQLPSLHSGDLPSYVEAGGELGAAIRALRRDVRLLPSPALDQVAFEQLRRVEAQLGRASKAQMVDWLTRLAGCVDKPPPRQVIASKAWSIWDLCEQLPVGVWCDETRREWLRQPSKGSFWPSDSEIHTLLANYAGRLIADRNGCREVMAAMRAPVQGGPKAPDETEIAAVTAKLIAWRSEQHQAGRFAAEAAERTRPAYLTRPQLMAAYRGEAKMGNPIAQERADRLAAELGDVDAEGRPCRQQVG